MEQENTIVWISQKWEYKEVALTQQRDILLDFWYTYKFIRQIERCFDLTETRFNQKKSLANIY